MTKQDLIEKMAAASGCTKACAGKALEGAIEGARCVKHARRDLCGGYSVMVIPAAMKTLRYKYFVLPAQLGGDGRSLVLRISVFRQKVRSKMLYLFNRIGQYFLPGLATLERFGDEGFDNNCFLKCADYKRGRG